MLIVDFIQAAGRSNLSVGSYRPSDLLSHLLIAYLVITLVPIDLVVLKRLTFLLLLSIVVVSVELILVGCQRTSL